MPRFDSRRLPAALLSALVALLLVASAADAADWTQYGFSARHASINNSETTLSRSNVGRLALARSDILDTSVPTSPIVAGSQLFVGSGATINAFDATSGAPRWTQATCSGRRAAQPAYAGSRVFVADAGGNLAAFDPATGARLWCREQGGSITSAVAVAGTTAYVTNGSALIAARQSDGARRWRFTPADGTPVENTPAVSRGIVYATGGGDVFAVSANDGHLLWRVPVVESFPGQTGFLSSVSVSSTGDTVYVGGWEVHALDATTGARLWTNTTITSSSMPTVYGTRLFVTTQDPNFGLQALSANTGETLWRAEEVEESLSTPTVANGVVYAAGDPDLATGLMTFNAGSGARLGWIADPDPEKPLQDQPAVVNGRVYASTCANSGTNRIDVFQLP